MAVTLHVTLHHLQGAFRQHIRWTLPAILQAAVLLSLGEIKVQLMGAGGEGPCLQVKSWVLWGEAGVALGRRLLAQGGWVLL